MDRWIDGSDGEVVGPIGMDCGSDGTVGEVCPGVLVYFERGIFFLEQKSVG